MSAIFFQKFINSILRDSTGQQVDKSAFQKLQEEIYKTLATIQPLTGKTTLSSGTATVTPTAPDGSTIPCTTASKVWVTAQDDNSTGALRVDAASGNFVIKSSNAGDHGVVAWLIIP